MKKFLFLIWVLFLASCASKIYLNKDKCVELGGPILECEKSAKIN